MNPRAVWTPEMAFHYGIRPWETGRLTPRELDSLVRHYERVRSEHTDG